MSTLHRLFLFVLWILAPSAWAYDIRFCASVDVDYGDAAGGDIWDNNSIHKAARGFDFQVKRYTTGAILHSGTLYEAGPNAGCTPVYALTGSLIFRVLPSGEVGANTFSHRDATAVDVLSVTPIADWTFDGTISYGDEIRHEGCCSSNASIMNLSDTTALKYKIGHELGHMVSRWRVGSHSTADLTSTDDCDGTVGGGGGGGYLAKQYQSKAIVQGIASWYGVITWNNKGESDCDYRNSNGTDWDLDGTEDVGELLKIDCAGDPDDDPPDHTDGVNWLKDMIDEEAGDCTGTLAGRSTQYDWIHYLWNLYNKGDGSPGDGLTANQIYDIFFAAVPSTWDEDGDGTDEDDPWRRWDDAARSLSEAIEDAHLAQLAAVNN